MSDTNGMNWNENNEEQAMSGGPGGQMGGGMQGGPGGPMGGGMQGGPGGMPHQQEENTENDT